MLKTVKLSILALPLLVGCASQSYSPRIDYIGAYRDAESVNELAESVSDREAADVPVLLNELPSGVSSVDGKIAVSPESQWILVAEATADPNGGPRFWFRQFYDYNDDESWRKGFCYWQVPLHWVTLGLWFLVPTDYACNVSEDRSVQSANKRKERVVRTLQRAAKATHSDLVVLTGERKTSLVHAGTGVIVSTLEWNGGSGYLFKKKQ